MPETDTRGLIRWNFVNNSRIKKGLCRDCGKRRGAKGTNDRCAPCADKRREYQRAYRATVAAKKAAGEFAEAVGDTVPRVPTVTAAAKHADPAALELGSGRRLALHLKPSAKPSPSVDPDRPWSSSHWNGTLTIRGADGKREGGAFPVRVSAGPSLEGRAPTVSELLAVLLRDADDAPLAFAEWCGKVGMSTDSIRAHKSHILARNHAAALNRFLAGDLAGLRTFIFGRKA